MFRDNFFEFTGLTMYVVDSRVFNKAFPKVSLGDQPAILQNWTDVPTYAVDEADPYFDTPENGTMEYTRHYVGRDLRDYSIQVTRPDHEALEHMVARSPDRATATPWVTFDGVVFVWIGPDYGSVHDLRLEFARSAVQSHPPIVVDASQMDMQPWIWAAEVAFAVGTVTMMILASRPGRSDGLPSGEPEEALLSLMERAGVYLRSLRTSLWVTGVLLGWAALSLVPMVSSYTADAATLYGPRYSGAITIALAIALAGLGFAWASATWRVHRELTRWRSIQESVA